MTSRIVVLGGGTGGTLVANGLRRRLGPAAAQITVVDQDNTHLYQPGLLFVPFGLADAEEIVRPRKRQLHQDVTFVRSGIDRVDLGRQTVSLTNGDTLGYDVLVLASGARLAFDETEGLTGPGWMERVFTFYTLDGAAALERALSRFGAGRLVVSVFDMPIKCPVAPLEFCLLADWYFTEKGIRDRISLSFVMPLDESFTRPIAIRRLSKLARERGIEVVTGFNTEEVDGMRGDLVSRDGHKIGFDMAVVVPRHTGARFIGRSSGLGDDHDFVPTDPRTMQSSAATNVFVIGDAAKIPASKAGSVTQFEGATIIENVIRFLEDRSLDTSYDGRTNCFIESGIAGAPRNKRSHGTHLRPGNPAGRSVRLGQPESGLDHLDKLMFQWFYWHILLPGRDLPGIGSELPEATSVGR